MDPERPGVRCVAGLAVVLSTALLAAACTGAPSTQPEDSGSASPPTVTASAGAAPGDNGQTPPQDTAGPSADPHPPSPPMPSRTADATGPFGRPDLWIGAGPPTTGLQRSLGAGDIPGTLLSFGGTAPGAEYAVRDTCDLPDLLAKAEAAGTAFWLNPWLADRLERCMSLHRFEVTYGTSSRGWRYFATRADAEQWITRQQDDTARRTTLPTDTSPFGVKSSHSPFGIMYAPFDAPIDEVRVLSETIAVSGGVLRGLVRNWSRRLWAYEVTVSAGEHAFSWPLSVQPGEVAPFEIGGWDGPTDPEQIQFTVDAEMSWHTDPSRAFRDRFEIPLALEVGELRRRLLPDGARDRYAHVTGDVPRGSVSAGSVELPSISLGRPTSHLSLHDVYGVFAIGDLRGYGAVFDSRGRIVDVGPAPAVGAADTDGRGAVVRFEEITHLPHPLAAPRPGSQLAAIVVVLFDIHTAVRIGDECGAPGIEYRATAYFIDEIDERNGPRVELVCGGFITWIGAAHPERAKQ